MKNVFVLVVLLTLAACSTDRVKISGRIENADRVMLNLDEVDVYNIIPADSVRLRKNGKFSFTFRTDLPCFYQLRLSPDKVIVLFPSPGEHIRINADALNLQASLKTEGSHDTEQINNLIQALMYAKARLDSISVQFNETLPDSVVNRLNLEYREILDRHRKASIAYIITHHSSMSSLYALYQQYEPGSYVFYKTTDIQFFKIVSDSLSKYYPGSKHVAALKAYTNKLIGDYKAQVIRNTASMAESSLPLIALPDMKGDTVSLGSLKGKLVLLSFWAASDEASVSQNLALKKIYEKYRGKGFEIYQVSFDNSVERWLRAVRYDELPWISVIDARYPNSNTAGNYNVTQIPANYLIGRDHVSILAKNLTPGQLEEKLRDLYH